MSAAVVFLPEPGCSPCEWRRPLEAAPSLSNLGHSAIVPVNQTALVTVVDLQAKCTLGEMIAIVIGLDCPPGCGPLPAPAERPVEAIVLPRIYLTWSLGGATFRAALDARHGLVVSVPADSVMVQAVVLAYSPDGVDPGDVATPHALRVEAGFAYGCGAVREAARLTQIVHAAPGEIQTIAIPPFASGFSLVPLGGAALTAEVRTSGGAGPWPTYTALAPTESVTGFPLLNGARCLAIDNTAGTDTVRGFVVFALDL